MSETNCCPMMISPIIRKADHLGWFAESSTRALQTRLTITMLCGIVCPHCLLIRPWEGRSRKPVSPNARITSQYYSCKIILYSGFPRNPWFDIDSITWWTDQCERVDNLNSWSFVFEDLYKLFQIESSISVKLSVQQTTQLREAPF